MHPEKTRAVEVETFLGQSHGLIFRRAVATGVVTPDFHIHPPLQAKKVEVIAAMGFAR